MPLTFPVTHSVPVTWLMRNACPSIRCRLATEVFTDLLDAAQLEGLRAGIGEQAQVRQIAKKQKGTGVWGGNLLGISPNKAGGIKDVGTVPQFRRLVELGASPLSRPLRLGSRLLFRLVSRDADPTLLFEYSKYGAAEPGAEPWIRERLREAAAAALAHAGHGDDPRVRGAAHKILNDVSQFVRSELAGNPFVRSGRAWVLHPEAHPPTIFSVDLLAHLPAVQRERAGLVERLGSYLMGQPSRRAFVVSAGKKQLRPSFLLLGEALRVSAAGQPDDLPFALYWMELLARLGVLHLSEGAAKVWARLVKELDEEGVWRPKNLRSLPRSRSPWAYHYFPLEPDTRKSEARFADVTFRMALIARLAGWELTRT